MRKKERKTSTRKFSSPFFRRQQSGFWLDDKIVKYPDKKYSVSSLHCFRLETTELLVEYGGIRDRNVGFFFVQVGMDIPHIEYRN